MKLPLYAHNPAYWMAGYGLMRVTGQRLRWLERGCEIEGELDYDRLLSASQSCAAHLGALSTDGEIDAKKWMAVAINMDDREGQDWCAALASQSGPKSEIKPSLFRLVSGQQKWIGSLQRAAEAVTVELLQTWAESKYPPLIEGKSMLGLDPESFKSAAYTAGKPWSASHPVTLWLTAEALVGLPCVPRGDAKQLHTKGWRQWNEVRFPYWEVWKNYDQARNAVQTSWIMMQDMTEDVTIEADFGQVKIPVGELLMAEGVSEVLSYTKAMSQYYGRLSQGVEV